MVAVASTCDGGIPGFGAVGYVVCEDAVTQERTSKLACSNSKRNVPADMTKSMKHIFHTQESETRMRRNTFFLN